MTYRLENRVALVTGAGSGIGRATALALAKEGARVVVSDTDDKGGQATLNKLQEAGARGIYVHADVSKTAEVESLMKKTEAAFGRLDAAVNNAGIEGAQAATAEYTEENWDRVIEVNLKGVWLCMKYEIPLLLKQGKGSIINMASVAGIVGFQMLPAYCASKGGVIQLTRAAALEYAKAGLRINALCPGVILTPMVERVMQENPALEQAMKAQEPVGRFGRPEEIAAPVVWLCSDESSFVTGQAIAVDGGFITQ